MDLLDACYKYINRFINSYQLEELLLDLENDYDGEDKKTLDNLVKEVQRVIDDTAPNADEKEKKATEVLNENINFNREYNSKVKHSNAKINHNIQKDMSDLEKEKYLKSDKKERYEAIKNLITVNPLYKKEFKKMDREKLLSFITQNISVSFPPELDQKDFDELANIAINKDMREELWRLAFNYGNTDMNFNKIIDYYIEKADAYYLIELLSAVKDNIDMNYLLDKLLESEDDYFVKRAIDEAEEMYLLTKEEKKYFENKRKK